ncbi:MAG TPA: EfeM/EfeO family lipoprotein [Amycolatopsis sp.]|uniref:EfeM/EfeO family lipoprotein n=1 Tax=Amycolatopsis sp. TaxID=37632 RepID=UPI002B4A4EF8|nr:EfeM/EfeO family lipoprotein [Amycolatopsis sp.]HKS49086.1 EfeM/EfeO family lipoprotein [Amycolatopsis sp.]
MSRWVLGLVLALSLLLFGSLILWRTPTSASLAPAAEQVITVGRSGCGQGWTRPDPGPQTLQLRNTGSVTAEAALIDPATGTVYGEVEGLAPGTTRPLEVSLGNGTYAFRCLPEETDAIVGPSVTITGGQERSGPAVVPVTGNDLLAPLKAYKEYVGGGLDTLATDTDALREAVRSQNRAAAQTAWLTAHLDYERLGAAYGAFGDSDGAINGTADGLPAGTTDPGFTGFHRLENGLWHNEAMPALAAVADDLDTEVHKLRDRFGSAQIDAADLGLRAHEIMENTLQFELTGRTDYGSGTGIATALANLDGTRAVLNVLRPLLVSRLSALSQVDDWLNRAEAVLRSVPSPEGSRPPVAGLDRPRREKINGVIGELTERLAPIAAITEPRRTS